MPSIIRSNKTLFRRFLRGIFDTDGSLSFESKYGEVYPRIKIGITSQRLIRHITEFLKTLKYRFSSWTWTRQDHRDCYIIELKGREMVERWFHDIGSLNRKHIKRYQSLDGPARI
ncbi:MAG: LAGLIDADG family homing endonuclease [Halobacteriaceae archaeon]